MGEEETQGEGIENEWGTKRGLTPQPDSDEADLLSAGKHGDEWTTEEEIPDENMPTGEDEPVDLVKTGDALSPEEVEQEIAKGLPAAPTEESQTTDES